MLTTTHVLVGAAVATRSRFRPWQITLGWLGGFAPDASIFFMFGLSRVSNMPGDVVWREPDGLYWQEPWQTFSAISNSIPLWLLGTLVGLFLLMRVDRYKAFGLALLIFSAAGLTHVIADFLTHADDAHKHMWPLTDWRFNSPVSYWQDAYYAQQFRIFETLLNVGLMIFLVVSFKQWPVRILAVLLALPPVLMQFLAPAIF